MTNTASVVAMRGLLRLLSGRDVTASNARTTFVPPPAR